MVLGVSGAVKAVGDAISKGFELLKENKEHQSETQIIKDKKRLKKATDIAEEAFKIVFRNFECLPEKEQDRFKNLYDDFLEHN
ncbi:MAG: hypothetical protein KHX03_09570 [Clostridium sp.]|nr:hypothetical protein [Clostridium sp.]